MTYKDTIPAGSDILALKTGYWIKGTGSDNLLNLPPDESTANANVLVFNSGMNVRRCILYSTSSHFYVYNQVGNTGVWNTIL